MKSRRDLRLASGLVLFTYLTLHLACHAFGLISLDAAESALRTTVLLWHSPVGTLLLYGAAAVHVGLALLAVYDRRTLRMPPVQALRVVLGLTMPVVLIGHFVGTRFAFERFGLPAEYQRVVANIWATHGQGRQLALLAPGWLHGCLGLNLAFGSRLGWQRLRFALFGVALLLPVLASLGFLSMGRELAEHHAEVDAFRVPVLAAQGVALVEMHDGVLGAYLGLIGLVFVARGVRSLDERRRKTVVWLSYPGRKVSVPRGWSVLEASRSFGIAHQSMCGGRARCTTCRVRVTDGQANCPPPDIDERRALDRLNADATVRLACQLRPTGDIVVQPSLLVEQTWWRAVPPDRPTTERELAVLFFDVRGVGTQACSAHDTIYALDRFQSIVSAAIESGGGVQCRHTGDGWMVLFGLEADGIRGACMQALDAARQIEERSAEITARLILELDFDVGYSSGVHVGPVVVGTIGEGAARRLAAVGDAIRAVERMRALAQRCGARFVISRAAATAVGIADPALQWRTAGDGAEAVALHARSAAQVLALAQPHSS